MKIKMLSSIESRQGPVSHKDQTAKAIKIINAKENREYLLKTTQVTALEDSTFTWSKKDELNSVISDLDAPVSLRQAAHYLVYKASSFDRAGSDGDVFAFD